jgi:hypothetical protein
MADGLLGASRDFGHSANKGAKVTVSISEVVYESVTYLG